MIGFLSYANFTSVFRKETDRQTYPSIICQLQLSQQSVPVKANSYSN